MELNRVLLELDRAIGDRVIEIALGVHAELVENPPAGTPVDTSWASVNWWPALGTPATGNSGPVGEVNSRQSGQSQGVASVAAFDFAQALSIWITNGVPYIGRLNDGWSQQSPAGFVEDAIEVTLNRFKGKTL